MAAAQNGRELLPWLTNPRLPHNALPASLSNQFTKSEGDCLWVVRIREIINRETPTAIVKDKPGSRSSNGGIFKWEGACDAKNRNIFLSFRNSPNSEKYVLRKTQSRLDEGNAPAANSKPLEIAVVHNPGIEEEALATFVHALRNRWPYFASDVTLPFPFPFATKAKEYTVSPREQSYDSDKKKSDD